MMAKSERERHGHGHGDEVQAGAQNEANAGTVMRRASTSAQNDASHVCILKNLLLLVSYSYEFYYRYGCTWSLQ